VILAAGLLVLLGLGLFIGGLATGTTALYWSTVAVCAVAAVLLVFSRRRTDPAPEEPARPADPAAGTARSVTRPPAATTASPASAEESGPQASKPPADGAAPANGRVPVDRPQHAATAPTAAVDGGQGEPPVEEVEVTDLLLVVDLKDEVYVVDEHPRYHVAGCARLAGQEAVPLPLDEARTDGFTPCGVCAPDRTLAERERARRKA
jgi:hypothetical protein